MCLIGFVVANVVRAAHCRCSFFVFMFRFSGQVLSLRFLVAEVEWLINLLGGMETMPEVAIVEDGDPRRRASTMSALEFTRRHRKFCSLQRTEILKECAP